MKVDITGVGVVGTILVAVVKLEPLGTLEKGKAVVELTVVAGSKPGDALKKGFDEDIGVASAGTDWKNFSALAAFVISGAPFVEESKGLSKPNMLDEKGLNGFELKEDRAGVAGPFASDADIW